MILLSFDIEEFDVPKEHQVDISMEEQIKVSVEGTTRILDCLERNQVKATFFCTANFALHAPDIIKRIQEGGHEIASHGFYHWTFDVEDLKSLRNAPTKLMDQAGYGKGYKYAHDYGGFAGLEFMPETLKGKKFYEPNTRNAAEAKIAACIRELWKDKYK